MNMKAKAEALATAIWRDNRILGRGIIVNAWVEQHGDVPKVAVMLDSEIAAGWLALNFAADAQSAQAIAVVDAAARAAWPKQFLPNPTLKPRTRQEAETAVVLRMIEYLERAGWMLAYARDDEGDRLTAKHAMESRHDKRAAQVDLIEWTRSCDQGTLHFVREGKPGAHTVFLVFGNADDGSEVVSDWSERDDDDFGQVMDSWLEWMQER